MLKINPDFLISREVEFEIFSRGEEPAASAEEKRKQLRGLIRSGKAIVSIEDIQVEPERDLEWCKERTGELLVLVEDVGENPDKSCRVVFRLRMGLEHMERRLSFWSQLPDADSKWSILPILTKVREAVVKLSPTGSSSTDEGGPSGSLPVQTIGAPTATAEDTPVSVSTEVPRTTGATISVPGPMPTSVYTSVPMTSSQGSVSYNRLPNPLGLVLQQLPTTDGLEVNELLQFLGVLLRVREFPGMTEAGSLQIAYPYCRSPLTEILLHCLESGAKFDNFHRAVLETFIPGRMKERLCQERLYRLQNPGETLASFVSSIKWVSRVLRVGMPESEVVGTILEGITPEERSRLVFAQRPSTFADLDKLSVTSRMVAYTDGLRRGQRSGQASQNAGQVMSVREVRSETADRSPREFVCWGCGQKGHTRRFCRQTGRAPSQQHNPTPAASAGYPMNQPKNAGVGGERPN